MVWILHFSDFHVGKDDVGIDYVFAKTLLHVRERVALGIIPDLVAITGDIADEGKLEEYQKFDQHFLRPLFELFGDPLSWPPLFLVPGNHDLDRSKNPAAVAGAASVPGLFDPSKEGQELRNEILPRFKNFSEYKFLDRMANTWINGPDGALIQTHETMAGRLGIVGLHTAWLSRAGEDRGRLTPGSELLKAALLDLEHHNCDLIVVLGHHAPSWYKDDERGLIEAELAKAGALFLCGHEHRSHVDFPNVKGRSYLLIKNGANFQSREDKIWANGFNWYHLSRDTLDLEVFRWSRSDRTFIEISDILAPEFRVGVSNRFRIKLPQSVRLSATAAGPPRLEERCTVWLIENDQNPKALKGALSSLNGVWLQDSQVVEAGFNKRGWQTLTQALREPNPLPEILADRLKKMGIDFIVRLKQEVSDELWVQNLNIPSCDRGIRFDFDETQPKIKAALSWIAVSEKVRDSEKMENPSFRFTDGQIGIVIANFCDAGGQVDTVGRNWACRIKNELELRFSEDPNIDINLFPIYLEPAKEAPPIADADSARALAESRNAAVVLYGQWLENNNGELGAYPKAVFRHEAVDCEVREHLQAAPLLSAALPQLIGPNIDLLITFLVGWAWVSQPNHRQYEQAARLFCRLVDREDRARLQAFGPWAAEALEATGQTGAALEMIEAFLPLIENPESAQTDLFVTALYQSVRLLLALGQNQQARDRYQQLSNVLNRTNGDLKTRYQAHLLLLQADLQPANSRKTLQEALELFQTRNHIPGQAVTLNQMGFDTLTRGDTEQAQKCFEQSLLLTDSAAPSQLAAATHNNLGECFKRLGNFEQARAQFRQAVNINRQIGLRGGLVKSLNNLGLVFEGMGDWFRAEAQHRLAWQLGVKLNDPLLLARVANNLANVETHLGRHDEAERLLEQAGSLAQQAGDHDLSLVVMVNLQELFLHRGRLEGLVGLGRKIAAIMEKTEDGSLLARASEALWRNAMKLSKNEIAKKHADRALDFYRQAGQPMKHANFLHKLAEWQTRMPNAGDPFQTLHQAYAIYQKVNHFRGLADIENTLGSLYLKTRQWAEAQNWLQKSLDHAEQLDQADLIVPPLLNLANCLAEKKDLNEALKHLDRAINLLQSSSNPPTQAHAYFVKGDIHARQSEWDEALAAWQKALLLYEQLRDFFQIAHITFFSGEILLNQKDNPHEAVKHFKQCIGAAAKSENSELLLQYGLKQAALLRPRTMWRELQDLLLQIRISYPERNLPDPDPRVITLTAEIAFTYAKQHNWSDALRYFEEAAHLAEKKPDGIYGLLIKNNLAYLYGQNEFWQKAHRTLKEVLENFERDEDLRKKVGRPDLLRLNQNFGIILRNLPGMARRGDEFLVNAKLLEEMSDVLKAGWREPKTMAVFDLMDVERPEPRLQIHKLEIHNFKNIQDLELDFCKNGEPINWCCLAGINGAGKTAVLQALALVLMGEETAAEYGSENLKGFCRRNEDGLRLASDIHVTLAFEGEAPVTLWLPLKTNGGIDDDQLKNNRKYDEMKVMWNRITQGMRQMVLAYGASRNLSRVTETLEKFSGKNTDYTDKITLFEPLSQVAHAPVLLHLHNLDAVVYKALSNLLSDVFAETDLDINLGETTLQFKMHDSCDLSMIDLPDGFRATLVWMVDLICHWHARNPFLEKIELSDIRGIVLIDEIDLHLHPQLQRVIIPRLRARLPGIQWFVTTHSPLILFNFELAELKILENTGGVRVLDRDIIGFTVEEVYDYLMDTDKWSPRYRKVLEDLAAAEDSDDVPKDERERLAMWQAQSPDTDEKAAREVVERRRRLISKIKGDRAS